MKTYRFVTESTLTEAKDIDVLKKAVATVVNFDVKQFQNKEATKALADAFRTMVTSQDLGIGSFLEKILPQIKAEADAAKITMEETETPEEAAGETEEVAAEPTAEENAAHEAEETPAEETAEHAEGGSEAGTEAAEGEVPKAESVKIPEEKVVTESLVTRMAEYFLD